MYCYRILANGSEKILGGSVHVSRKFNIMLINDRLQEDQKAPIQLRDMPYLPTRLESAHIT
jgi:hypothetical protein